MLTFRKTVLKPSPHFLGENNISENQLHILVSMWKYTYLAFLKSVKLFLSRIVFPTVTMLSTKKHERNYITL